MRSNTLKKINHNIVTLQYIYSNNYKETIDYLLSIVKRNICLSLHLTSADQCTLKFRIG